jgi:hypothetical protein
LLDKVANIHQIGHTLPMFNYYYMGLRITADRIGLDPWDVDMQRLRTFTTTQERKPVSRFWFGSPCRFIRSIDVIVHVWLPGAITEKYPELAIYLRSTSPRWGGAWRDW